MADPFEVWRVEQDRRELRRMRRAKVAAFVFLLAAVVMITLAVSNLVSR